ncbi:hypothetical protein LTR37_010303 [Vermiconidia calcicola]|uniref:Uncharacterized protein n=1 Tax=Vermiconidia calcicola TaxID=1690605 RepID=A0ACC3N5D6_9PEZI|nr:hypothetical protein LTR37_010303 [Vermiconidia calcicola]
MERSAIQSFDGNEPKEHKRRKAQLETGVDQAQKHNSTLLGLPAELRTLIYEYSLVEQRSIRVTKQLKQPALLLTCRQVRTEALELWYRSNTFKTAIADCDASLHQSFYVHLRKVGTSVARSARITMSFHGTMCNWDNLARWCYAIWTAQARSLRYRDGLCVDKTVIYAAHNIATECRNDGVDWKTCEKMLKNLRLVAGNEDPEWLE